MVEKTFTIIDWKKQVGKPSNTNDSLADCRRFSIVQEQIRKSHPLLYSPDFLQIVKNNIRLNK